VYHLKDELKMKKMERRRSAWYFNHDNLINYSLNKVVAKFPVHHLSGLNARKSLAIRFVFVQLATLLGADPEALRHVMPLKFVSTCNIGLGEWW
jgi:hypothetical protein